MLAAKYPLAEVQLGSHRTTGRAGLAGRIERVGGYQPDATPPALVVQQPAELPEPGIRDRPGQSAIAQHPLDVELLDNHAAMLSWQSAGQLVEPIAADAGSPCFQLGDSPAGLLLATAGVPAPGGDALAFLPVPLALQPAAFALCPLQGPRVGDLFAGGQHRQLPDARVHPDRARVAVGSGELADHLAGERHIPAVGHPSDGGREDPAGAALKVAGELAGRLVSLDDPDPRELDVLAVGQDPDRPRGEPAGISAPALLEPREADSAAVAAAVPGVSPVLQRPRQAVQPRGIGFLAVVRPPGRGLVLGVVPFAPQRRQRPRHLDLLPGRAGVQALFDQLKAPVVGESGPTNRRGERALLARGRVQCEPVRLVDGCRCHHVLRLAAVRARSARLQAQRWPYCRAQKLVSTSTICGGRPAAGPSVSCMRAD
jgi:hypothetical protein